MNLREKAAADKERIRQEQVEQIERSRAAERLRGITALSSMLRDRLGITVEPDDPTIVVDGVTFTAIQMTGSSFLLQAQIICPSCNARTTATGHGADHDIQALWMLDSMFQAFEGHRCAKPVMPTAGLRKEF